MSSDTRMLPRKSPQTTGIPRTTTAPSRPMIGGQGGSGVSASPAADKGVQAHVKKANEGRMLIPTMPGAQVADAPRRAAHEGAQQLTYTSVPTLDAQQTAFLVYLIDAFLSDESATPDAREFATRTLETLAQMAGGQFAAQRIALAQAGDARPPIVLDPQTDAPSQEG